MLSRHLWKKVVQSQYPTKNILALYKNFNFNLPKLIIASITSFIGLVPFQEQCTKTQTCLSCYKLTVWIFYLVTYRQIWFYCLCRINYTGNRWSNYSLTNKINNTNKWIKLSLCTKAFSILFQFTKKIKYNLFKKS